MTDFSMLPPDDAERSTETLDAQPFGEPDTAKGPLMQEIPEGEAGREIQKKVAKLALRIWESKDKLMERVEAQWKVNAARRRGISNAKVHWSDIDEHWTAYLPKHASADVTPDVNKAATLCRRAVSNLFADPPAPEVVPPSGEDEDVAAAEFSERALIDLQSETGLNTVQKARTAFDRASTFGSGYEHFSVDPKGGGKQPIQVQARRDAQHVDTALIDPATIQMGTDELGQPKPIPGSGVEQGPYVKRYVKPDGTLTDKKQEAATRWAPALKSEVLDGRYVRLIPHTCDDIWDAYGTQVASFVSWGELKQMEPAIAELSEADQKAMLEWRPKNADDLIPGGKNNDVDAEKNKDERLVFTLTTYYRQCEDYPEGLYLVTVGDQFVLERREWVGDNDGLKEPLDIPITQYAQFAEGRDGYWKVGLMELLGGGNETRYAQVAHWLDHLDHLNNRKTFVPTNSILQPEQMAMPRAMIAVNPGGEPKYEEIPPFPPDAKEMYALMGEEMDDAAGFLDTARESSDADSGRQAYAVISQVHAGLSEIRENVIRGYTRGSRITLQLARAFFDVPRELRWNENGKYRHKAWTGADLTSTTDVRIKAGTMTMTAPTAKAQLAEHYASMQVLTPDELREILASGMGATVGIRDEPFRLRIRNQLAEWAEGPPEGWAPQTAQIDPGSGLPMVDPMTGQDLVPPDPVFALIFEPTPCDSLPNIAQIRVTEIARFMATAKYMRHPREWRAGLDAEYALMVQAANPVPPLEPGQPSPAAPPSGSAPGGPKPEPMGGVEEEGQIPGAPPIAA